MYPAIPRFLFLEERLSCLCSCCHGCCGDLDTLTLKTANAIRCALSIVQFDLPSRAHLLCGTGRVVDAGCFNALCRQSFTEPLLAALPIVAGAWVFLTLIYLPFSLAWVNFATGRMGYFASAIEGIGSLKVQSIQALMVVPLTRCAFSCKEAYVFLFVWARSLRPNPSFHRTLRDRLRASPVNSDVR